MLSADGRYVVTFNGEIYNYRELRGQLTSHGHTFKTNTDTEVLLAAFAEWKDECLAKLNGMFAFAIWDNEERALTLARDHVGIKPLYYSHVPSASFSFASEIKSILATGLEAAAGHGESSPVLTFLWAPDPNTLFGSKTVPPGHVLKLKDDQLKLTQWWDVSFDEIERRSRRSVVAGTSARNTRSSCENGDDR